MNDRARALEFVRGSEHMTLAVIAHGEPWAVPVRIQTIDGFILEWDSHPEAVHSQAIESHPTVSISIFRPKNGETMEFGFYAIAEATKVADIHDQKARYRAVVTKAWVNDHTHQKRDVEV